jgi:hypothetical protein
LNRHAYKFARSLKMRGSRAVLLNAREALAQAVENLETFEARFDVHFY